MCYGDIGHTSAFHNCANTPFVLFCNDALFTKVTAPCGKTLMFQHNVYICWQNLHWVAIR